MVTGTGVVENAARTRKKCGGTEGDGLERLGNGYMEYERMKKKDNWISDNFSKTALLLL
ncbi:hypothetical protein D8674_026116 [Pyrus ussuriensis x Pyrus communis]|uniref:Uncharacterized protein n=1 Tax=Pyrus ussuriensis x Pyrus communis TaxID=2448454 RepID=A0A5N5IAT5_9ROSA|nr:hypothetical protein D8674_026116 [Pyrus ussuriensis x Pyrus communis]